MRRYCHTHLLHAQMAMRVVVCIHLALSVIDIVKYKTVSADNLREYDQKSEVLPSYLPTYIFFRLGMAPQPDLPCTPSLSRSLDSPHVFCPSAFLSFLPSLYLTTFPPPSPIQCSTHTCTTHTVGALVVPALLSALCLFTTDFVAAS
jgi:hypothetical protein